MKNQIEFNDTLLKIRNNLIGISLDISSQGLTDNNILTLTQSLSNNHSITSLDLEYNNIGANGARALANNHSITSLIISVNNIGADGATILANNHSITSLDLECNNIGDEAKKTINTMLKRNRNNAQSF